MLKGGHLIAGEWVDSDRELANTPVIGAPDRSEMMRKWI